MLILSTQHKTSLFCLLVHRWSWHSKAAHPGCDEGGASASSWKTNMVNLAHLELCQRGHHCHLQCHFLVTGKTTMETIRLGHDKIGLFRKAIFHIHTDKATSANDLQLLLNMSTYRILKIRPTNKLPATQIHCQTSPSMC